MTPEQLNAFLTTTPAQIQQHRASWAEADANAETLERAREQRLEIAKRLGDDTAVAACRQALEDVRGARSAYGTARAAAEKALDDFEQAKRDVVQAEEAFSAGAPDRKTALARRDDVDVAKARQRYHAHALPSALASCSGANARLGGISRLDLEVVEESADLARALFEFAAPTVAIDRAKELGRKSNAGKAAFFPVAEELARDVFKTLAKSRKKEQPYNLAAEALAWRHDTSGEITIADLERCFAARREAFVAERRRVEAQLQALGGQLQTMGAA